MTTAAGNTIVPESKEDNEMGDNTRRQRGDNNENRTKYTLKNVIQTIFKNIKNVFTKDETNQPNDMLLRTTLIKKFIMYLVIAMMLMSTFYLIYITIYQQYLEFEFKFTSALQITKYHNLTIAVINEYAHRGAIERRPIIDPDFTLDAKALQLNDTKSRIDYSRNILMSMDIDTNVRSDLFFSTIGIENNVFRIRYNLNGGERVNSSKYTILMIMLEKLITIDNSVDDLNEANLYIEDNFLPIINKFFIDCFEATYTDASNILSSNRVYFI